MQTIRVAQPDEIGFEHGRIHSFRHDFVGEAFRQGAQMHGSWNGLAIETHGLSAVTGISGTTTDCALPDLNFLESIEDADGPPSET